MGMRMGMTNYEQYLIDNNIDMSKVYDAWNTAIKMLDRDIPKDFNTIELYKLLESLYDKDSKYVSLYCMVIIQLQRKYDIDILEYIFRIFDTITVLCTEYEKDSLITFDHDTRINCEKAIPVLRKYIIKSFRNSKIEHLFKK